MNYRRRRVLAVAGVLSVGAAGCLDDGSRPDDGSDADRNGDEDDGENGDDDDGENGDDDDGTDGGDDENSDNDENDTDDEYETCENEVVYYRELTDDLREEVDTALDEGSYEADRILLAEAMETEDAYLVKDGVYYEPDVSEDGTRLELSEDETPVLRNDRSVSVENDTDEEYEVTIELTADDGEILVEETAILESGESEVVGRTGRIGDHTLDIERDDGKHETHSVPIGPHEFDIIVSVDSLAYLQDVADPAPCPWAE